MVYQQVVGNAAVDTASATSGETVIDLNTSASVATTLTKAFAYCNGSGTGQKIKIFRDDGTNYNFIGEVTFNSAYGINEIAMNLAINNGDLIGYYSVNSNGIRYNGNSGSSIYRSGDISSNTAKNTWTGFVGVNSLNAGYDISDYYVKTTGDDTKDGSSWTNAWKTINKTATTAIDSTTVHIEAGTYDQEPSGNKIAPQNIGTTGIYYEFTGTVYVELNA